MGLDMKRPAANPCGSCPYRRDVPSGVWDASEYEKLPDYDGDTGEQPIGTFLCHQQNGRICAGWAGCHDMEDSLALRIAFAGGHIEPEELEATLDYATKVPLFGSGLEAAQHGMAGVSNPDRDARRVIDKLTAKQARRDRGERS